MPRTRKPQNGGQRFGTWRVANTTTGSTTTQAVYRIPTWNRKNCDVRNFEVTWVSPIDVHIEWENVYNISLDSSALKNVIEWYSELNLSNTEVTLSTVNWPITVNDDITTTWDISAVNVTATAEVNTDILNATTWNITTVNSTDITAASVSATDVSTATLEASGNASVGGTLDVTWATTLSSTLSVTDDVTLSWDLAVAWNETVTWNISWFDISASNSVNTVDLNATWTTALVDVTADDISASTITTTWDAQIWGALDVTWNGAIGWTLSVTWASSFTGESTFVGNVQTGNITSTGTATLNDVNVWGNETVAGTMSVTWNTTLNSALTVAWATTMSGNAAVGGNLSVSWNSTVTWTSTTTGNAIFNSDVTVAWDETVTGNTTIWGTLSATWDVTLADDLVVNWTTSLKALETDGSVDIDGTLRTTWAAVIWNGITVTWQVESDTVRTWEVVADEIRVTDWLYLSQWGEAPDFVLQSEKGQPNGVCPLDVNGLVDPQYLPPIYTTAIVKMGTWVFSNSNTAVVVDADITADSAVICTNYSDIVGDLNEVINIGQLTVVSNQVETGSFKYLIINPLPVLP